MPTPGGLSHIRTYNRFLLLVAGLGAVLLAIFIAIELRFDPPLVRLGIFRTRSLTGSNLVFLLVAGGMFSMFFFASLYVQEILGYSPLRAGLAFLPVPMAHTGSYAMASGIVALASSGETASTGPSACWVA